MFARPIEAGAKYAGGVSEAEEPVTLVLDSATARAVCGMVRGGRELAFASAEGGHAAQRALALVDEVLARAGYEAEAVAQIVVGCGPGSFTGLRIGIATARGLALALGRPCIGVSTLEALAAGAPGALALIDARRGEVFTPGEGGTAVAERPHAVAGRLAAGTLCVGDGATRYRTLLEEAGAIVPPDDDVRHAPGARALCDLAAGGAPEPVYVRRPDAEPRVA
ncbi:MAG: tRNA threonylcarbamoyladenosine biosynthesis protein TsaB [Gaiellales bacterium]|jgi:tRNA threonylcarbamoyl adenosine modification protein YeaZ|nr:tRNA threonylcarbamoyladenosine biosynthesis protein TsaB [Gaiellales bacterium]